MMDEKQVGMEEMDAVVSETDREQVVKEAKKKALYLLEKQDRTEYQLLEKLAEKGFAEDVAMEALQYVKAFHYVDDERYARQYVSYRQHTKSRRQLTMDLLRKGVDKEVIDVAIQEEYEGDERKMIQDLLDKRQFDPVHADYRETNRMMAFLLRRGFTMEDVKHCLKKR